MILRTLPVGVTAVTGVRLFSDEERTLNEQLAPVSLLSGQWHVDTLNAPAGRWWAVVDAVKGDVAYSYPHVDPVDLPEDDRLILSPEALAVEMDMTQPLTSPQRNTLRRAILAAQSDVYAYLGRPLLPQQYVQRGVWDYGESWDLTVHGEDEVVRVVSVVAETDPVIGATGTYTVTYLAGIDAREDEYEPIRRYVMAHAMNTPGVTRMWREVVKPANTIKSASTQGQSVSYDVATLGGGGAAGSGAPGALPDKSSMDRWRLAGRRVHQGVTQFGARYGL